MKPKSRTLFHFTKNISAIKGILREGFWPRYCLDDFGWYSQKIEYLAFPMVCFCDIPLTRIDEHVKFYGQYGIGVTKEWAVRNSLNPILYVSEAATISNSLKEIATPSEFVIATKQSHYLKQFMTVMSHTKPVEGKIAVGSKILEKEFYQESEWRYLAHDPLVLPFLSKQNYGYKRKRESLNKLAIKHCTAEVTPNDIRYIFVKNEKDIPSIISFIQNDLSGYPARDLAVLMSRVISLETIKSDM